MAKVTDEQIQEAINPDLSKDFVVIGIDEENQKRIKIKIMSARKEPVFLRELKQAVSVEGLNNTGDITGKNLISLLDNVPAEKIAILALHVIQNSGEVLTVDWLLDNASIIQMVELIKAQVDKQGYLDFLFKVMAALKLGKVR